MIIIILLYYKIYKFVMKRPTIFFVLNVYPITQFGLITCFSLTNLWQIMLGASKSLAAGLGFGQYSPPQYKTQRTSTRLISDLLVHWKSFHSFRACCIVLFLIWLFFASCFFSSGFGLFFGMASSAATNVIIASLVLRARSPALWQLSQREDQTLIACVPCCITAYCQMSW